MDFQRANRNLELVVDGKEHEKAIGSLDDVNVGDTQVPGSPGFSDGSDQDSDDHIFINTQVQGRLDEADQADTVRAKLTKFKFIESVRALSPKRNNITPQRTTARPMKKTTTKQRAKKCPTKAQILLKQLSGKHAKVQDMVRYQKKLDSLAEARESAKVAKDNRSRSGARAKGRYDTYNEEEWQRISKMLLDRFPHTEPAEVNGVYEYLYGETAEQTLWAASQLPVDSEKLESTYPSAASNSQRVSVLSLSQVMNDRLPTKREDSYQMDDDDSTIPDSTEESSMIIPIEPLPREQPEDEQMQLDTPDLSAPNEIIDLTQESFKVVKSLTSPLKQESGPQVQVPATRLPTLSGSVELGPAPSLVPPKEQPLRYKVDRSQLKEFSSVEGLIVHSLRESLDDDLVADTESETSTLQEHCIIELEPSILASHTPSPSRQNDFESQSAQQLRESMRSMGLKTSRSKQQMLQSLQAASQVLKNSSTEHEQKQEIHKYLTSLIQLSPTLLEKVYTFQPIASKELLTRLLEKNPFVEVIDEFTIREWADFQGICLTNS